jgi:hypothetical protein
MDLPMDGFSRFGVGYLFKQIAFATILPFTSHPFIVF